MSDHTKKVLIGSGVAIAVGALIYFLKGDCPLTTKQTPLRLRQFDDQLEELKKEASKLKPQIEGDELDKETCLSMEILLEKYIQICETNSNSTRLDVLREQNSVEYEKALEQSFQRIDHKALTIKEVGMKAIGVSPEVFEASVMKHASDPSYDKEIETRKASMRGDLLSTIELPKAFLKEKGDEIYSKFEKELTDFGSKIWDRSMEERQGLLVIQMQKLIDKSCVQTGLTEEQVGKVLQERGLITLVEKLYGLKL